MKFQERLTVSLVDFTQFFAYRRGVVLPKDPISTLRKLCLH